MLCPRCGKPVPPGAAFCPSCGAAVAAPMPTAARAPAAAPRTAAPATGAGVAADFEAQKRKNAMILAGVAVAAVVAGLIGAGAFLRLGASSGKPALQVRAEGPPSALQLPAHTNPAPLQVAAEKKQMPADVEAWLKHLEKCEQIKAELLDDQATKGMIAPNEIEAQKLKALMSDDGTDDGKAPNQFAKEKFVDDFKAPWLALQQKFLSVQPPEECMAVASAYNTGLSQMPDVTTDISKILGGDQSNPADAIKAVKKEMTLNTVAQKSFRQTDQGVSDICSKYDKRKWFDVRGLDIGGSDLTIPGGLGGGTEGLSGSALGQ